MDNSSTVPVSEYEALNREGYRIGKAIGRGGFGTVYLSEYRNTASNRPKLRACKVVDLRQADGKFVNKFFQTELDVLTKLERNPNVIQVYGIHCFGPRVFIFMEYAKNGNLQQFLLKHGPILEVNAKEWFRQLTSGLEYLHSMEIAHMDLKDENVLLTAHFNAKLADYGLSQKCIDNNGQRILSQTYCGSLAYAAPEIIEEIPYNPKLADVWSLGVVLYTMLCGEMPFTSNQDEILMEQVCKHWTVRKFIKDIVSKEVISLLTGILQPDVTERLTLNLIRSHSWLQ